MGSLFDPVYGNRAYGSRFYGPWFRGNRGAILGWILAVVFSAGLNLFLFGIMPGMISAVPQGPGELEEIQSLSLVRVKRAEPPARKKEKIKPPKPIQAKVAPVKTPAVPRPKLTPARLPFEVNAKLPVTEFALPPMAEFAMAGPAPKDFYMAGELDSPLIPLVKVPPIYPLRASRRGIQGWVTVEFLVNISGLVEDIRILDAKPRRIFDASVIKCVSQWKFKPGTVGGEAVATRAKTTIKFELEAE